MKIPGASPGVFNWIARWLYARYQNLWVRYLLAPVLLGLPPAISTAFYSNQVFRLAVLEYFPFSVLLLDYVVPAIVLSALYPAIVLAFSKSVIKRATSQSVDVDGLLALLTTIDDIVGCKEQRFAKHCRNRQGLTEQNAFRTITDPMQQIAEIVRGICNLFNATRVNKNRGLIRVTLAVIQDGQVIDIPVYFPRDEPVRAGLPVLNHEDSAIIAALRTRKIVIIENIENELKRPIRKRRFAASGHEQDDKGSLICFPVAHNGTNDIPYVISIHCDEPSYFKREFSELYEHSLQRFALRLSLEHSLLLLKEELCE